MTISRFPELFDTDPRVDEISWPDLFAEFSVKRPFLHRRHPGWSPAIFDPPKRALENIKWVHALALDYDNKTKSGDRAADPITIAAVADMLGDFYGLIHTTRSHAKDWPRFRVILPLTRPVSAWEYTALWQAAARRWPGLDPAPKDASRFWYTPGMGDHEGADFEAVTIAGAFLNPDEFLRERALATPPPPSDNQKEVRARAYIATMPEAISGAGGHAALWAVARKLVCDFELDEQAAFRVLATEYNPRCKPAWSDRDLQHKISDAANKARIKNPIPDRQPVPRQPERIIDPPGPESRALVDDNWEKCLRYNANGNLTKDVGNVALILKNAPGFAGSLMFDAMSNRIMWLKEPVYDVGLKKPQADSRLKDSHVVYVQQVMAKYRGLSMGRDIVYSAIEAAAHENEFHPVQDFLDHLPVWDGQRRVPNWLHQYVGAADNEYNAAVGRWWLISAVARAYQPGCQVDHMLILEGGQGAGKSQAVRALGSPWTLGTLPDIRDAARAADVIAAYWIVEVAELDALKGSSMTRIKDFVSQQVDSYRPAYGRSTIDRPRSCVFIGTTNESAYLNDPTGARRFWPVRVEHAIKVAELRDNRDQLWAEAKLLYQSGEQWHPEQSYVKLIQEEQADRYTEDDWSGPVSRWIKTAGPDGFTSEQILGGALGIEPGRWDRASQTRVGAILTKLGYARKRVMIDGERVSRYFKV